MDVITVSGHRDDKDIVRMEFYDHHERYICPLPYGDCICYLCLPNVPTSDTHSISEVNSILQDYVIHSDIPQGVAVLYQSTILVRKHRQCLREWLDVSC